MKVIYKIFFLAGVIFSLSFISSKKRANENCEAKFTKEELIAVGQAILNEGGNENIWNLHELDTSEFYTLDDYFISATEKSKLVLIGGIAGGSAGSSDNLLMIVDCYEDEINVRWAGQFGDIIKRGIVDVNKDGIKEIISNSFSVWMGECNDFNTVYNFSNLDDIISFRSHSYSFIECGAIDLKNHSKGDTLQLDIKFDLITEEDRSFVEEHRTIKIHNGGTTDEKILKNLLVKTDTIYTILK